MASSLRLRTPIFILVLVLVFAAGSFAGLDMPDAAAAQADTAQAADEDVPPGNPVIGSDRPGDIEAENTTRYGLWILVAACLITAGVLLVKIERWEAKRSGRLG